MKVADMHCDTISEIWYGRKADKHFTLLNNSLHIDIDKMIKGNYLLQNFAMFVNLRSNMDPLEAVMQLIDLFYQEMEKYPDKIGIVKSFQDIEKNVELSRMSAMLTVEEGGVCKGDLAYLRNLYRLGVRMMTLVWNYENELAFPNRFPGEFDQTYQFYPDKKNGLKEKGFLFLEEMERIGMIIDVSHLSDAGFYDVYQHTKKPFVASHSNARALCSHCRNLEDDMIRKLAERGGVIGLNYNADFLTEQTCNEDLCRSTVCLMAEHLRYLINIGGIESVGLGSDFDGISGELELTDCSKVPLLEEELRKRGYHESEIEAIFYKNVLRVYRELL